MKKPVKKPAFTPAQKLMVKDGMPASLIITPAQRAQDWKKNPPRSLPAPVNVEDAQTKRFKESLELQRAQAALKAAKSAPASSSNDPAKPQKRTRRTKKSPRDASLVTIATLCEEIGTLPRVARQLLRGAAIAKPAHGWAWQPDVAASIKNTLLDLIQHTPTPRTRKGAGKKPRVSKNKPPPPTETVWSGASKDHSRTKPVKEHPFKKVTVDFKDVKKKKLTKKQTLANYKDMKYPGESKKEASARKKGKSCVSTSKKQRKPLRSRSASRR